MSTTSAEGTMQRMRCAGIARDHHRCSALQAAKSWREHRGESAPVSTRIVELDRVWLTQRESAHKRARNLESESKGISTLLDASRARMAPSIGRSSMTE